MLTKNNSNINPEKAEAIKNFSRAVNKAFDYLIKDFGFELLPIDDTFRVIYTNQAIDFIIESVNFGKRIAFDIKLKASDKLYNLEKILAKRNSFHSSNKDLNYYAENIKKYTWDILTGDFSVFQMIDKIQELWEEEDKNFKQKDKIYQKKKFLDNTLQKKRTDISLEESLFEEGAIHWLVENEMFVYKGEEIATIDTPQAEYFIQATESGIIYPIALENSVVMEGQFIYQLLVAENKAI